MKILDYPRPRVDTGIGFHWFPDTYHVQTAHLDLFAPRLKTMGVGWLTVLSEPDKAIPESFMRGLIDLGIEPIVRLYTPKIRPLDQAELGRVCLAYARMGVHYVHVYNQPNVDGEWDTWSPVNLAERFVSFLAPCLETMYAVEGIVPVLTPLAPGGNFRDIEFFRLVLELLIASGKSYLFSKLAIGLHNYALNHPLDWGKGGNAAWPCATPDSTPPGCQDSNGFRQFEWYDELVRSRVGFSLPMISCENGAPPGSYQDRSHPQVDRALHAQRHAEMARVIMENEVPHYVFNNAFWILSAPDASMFADHRWFRENGDVLLPASVLALENLPKRSRPLLPTLHIPDTIRVLMSDGRTQKLELQEYLRGVVAAEMPASAPPEALKAQAIAARSYAVTSSRHAREGADVCGTTHCQAWTPQHNGAADRAVAETEGLVVSHGDRIIRAFYFAGCDGHTRNSEDVWAARLPYCRSVSCVKPLPRRKGHGVGLCQSGAIAMAHQGATAEVILRHYYTGCRVVEATADTPSEFRLSVIRGTVQDENGTARAEVRVILRSGTWSAQTTTNLQGLYQFVTLAAGTYTVELADTQVQRPGIEVDGTQTVLVDLVVPSAPDWTMEVRRQPGLRLLIGQMPKPGINVTVRNPWGNSVTLTSGSKPEYGPGGFEVPIWNTGLHTVRFLSQTFKVEIGNETVIVAFTPRSDSGAGTRLTSDWQPLAQAQALFMQVQQTLEIRNWFSLEKNSTLPQASAAADWQMQLAHEPGLRLIIGRLPRPGIPVTITDPWGNKTDLISGSKPEYGTGGFELPVWNEGKFTIAFYDQQFSVDIANDTLYVTFSTSEGIQGRLVSEWTSRALIGERLARLQAIPAFENAFKTEVQPA